MALLSTLLYIIFVLAAIILIVVILLQEGKGGGFGGALGTAGQETFGVGARGIQSFTGTVAMVFLVSALMIHIINRNATASSAADGVESISPIDLGTSDGGDPPAGK